jgi:biotin operon repressor
MNKSDKACIKMRILKLASLKCTGTPADLASKLEISERSVKRIVKEIREEGRKIRYDYLSISYVMKEN